MEMKQIKELVALMEQAGLKKLFIKEKGGAEIHIEREDKNPPPPILQPPVFHPASHVEHTIPLLTINTTTENHPSPGKKKRGGNMSPPYVGTFYTAASPEALLLLK